MNVCNAGYRVTIAIWTRQVRKTVTVLQRCISCMFLGLQYIKCNFTDIVVYHVCVCINGTWILALLNRERCLPFSHNKLNVKIPVSLLHRCASSEHQISVTDIVACAVLLISMIDQCLHCRIEIEVCHLATKINTKIKLR